MGPVQDADPYVADCMDGRGYRIADACSTVESPAQLERCYQAKK